MRGDTVILRVFGDGVAVARVWEEFPESICVLSQHRFPQYKQGVSDYWPIGFPRQDVFKCDEASWEMVKTGRVTWSKLAKYEG